MTIKEQLLQEIESSPDSLLEETLDFLKFLKTKQVPKKDNHQPFSTGSGLLEHLKTIGNWQGDDLKECLKSVKETRGKARFDRFNPFDKE